MPKQTFRDLRLKKGFATQEDLARKAGTNVGNIAHWEQGRRFPDLPHLMKLGKALGVTLDELAGALMETEKNR
jgi:transcriptional regulator with XRE-family HTH domain